MTTRRRLVWPAATAGLLLFGLAVASQFVAATYGAGGPSPPAVRPAALPEAVRGRLQVAGGAIPVLRLEGTPYEMGRLHGRVFRDQIEFLRREYFDALIVKAVGRRNLEEWARAVEPFIPERYREEMRGVAEGAGIGYGQVLLVNTMVDRFQSMLCSTVVAAGGATRDGEVYFGRNLDFPGRNVLQRATVVLVFVPEGGESSPVAAVTWPGLIGVLSGMNAHGVCGATMMIHRGTALRPGVPYTILYRDALARARSAGDVYDVIAGARRTCPNNFMVVDGSGKAEVVEFDAERAARRSAEEGTLCSTNFFRTDTMAGVGLRTGIGRYRRLENFLRRERGRIGLDEVRAALRDVARPWYMNVQSMVFLPARRALYLSVGGKLPAAAQRFVEIRREALFGDRAGAGPRDPAAPRDAGR